MSFSIDYDTDVLKHIIRRIGWIPAVRYRAGRVARRKLKYLTFCAANAIDVFSFEIEGFIEREPNTLRLEGVYFCEMIPEDFNTISTLIGSTEQGFLGEFAEVVLFEDSVLTKDKSIDELSAEPRNANLRRMLRLKETNNRLKSAFPFDVINLDVSGAMFPPYEPSTSRMFQAIRKVLDWQDTLDEKGRFLKEFTLFLTTKVATEELNPDAMADLRILIQENVDRYDDYHQVFVDKFGHSSAEALFTSNFPVFYSIGLSKLIINEAMMRNWDIEYRNVFLYQRSNSGNQSYYMVSTVAHLTRFKQRRERLVNPEGVFPELIRTRYVNEITETLLYSPKIIDLDSLNPIDRGEIEKNLKRVVRYRNKFRDGLSEE